MVLSSSQPLTEHEIAKISSQILSSYSSNHDICEIRLSDNKNVTIPTKVLPLLAQILHHWAKDEQVKITPIKLELTTSEAADILNVSRPYLVQLLESGEIPFRKVGVRRRILSQDLMIYKEKIDSQRKQILKELTAQAQDFNMGY